jgi:hypothetical protein
MAIDYEALKEQFRVELTPYLERLTPELIASLRNLLSIRFPPDMVELSFEVFPSDFTSEFPVYTYFMDEGNGQCTVNEGGSALIWNPPNINLHLLDVDCVYPPEFERKFKGYGAGFDTWAASSKVLIEWFHRCWLAAGGDRFDREAFIALHDDIDRFNLKTGEWVG